MTIQTLTSTAAQALDVLAQWEDTDRIGTGDAVIIAAGIDPSDDPATARAERRLALRTLAAAQAEVDRQDLHVVAAAVLPNLAAGRRIDLVEELADAFAVLDALEGGDASVVELFDDLPANGVSHQVHRLAMCDEQTAVIERALAVAVAA